MNSLRFVLALLLALWAFPAWGDPAITSTGTPWTHGQTVMVTGTGFGTKSTAAPIRWDNFEDGTLGQNITTGGYWSEYTAGSYHPLYSNAQVRPGSTKSITGTHHSTDGQSRFCRNAVGFAATGRGYVSFWVRWTWGDVTDPDNAWQFKLARATTTFTGCSTSPVDEPGLASFNFVFAGPPQYTQKQINIDRGTGSEANCGDTPNDSWPLSQNGTWRHVEWWFDQGTVNVADGTVALRYSRTGAPYTATRTDGSCPIGAALLRNVDVNIDAIRFGDFLANVNNGTGIAEIYWDDIYIDNNWARVFLADTDTYTTNMHRELQIPSAWSDTSVEVTVNRGSFAGSDNVYLYVVDSTGAVNADGFLIGNPIVPPLGPRNSVARTPVTRTPVDRTPVTR